MLTYGCGNVTQDDAAVGRGGCRRFGPPTSETNEAQTPNTNDDGANASGKLLLGRVINAAATQIRGPASGGLAPVNPGLTMAAAVSQATGQGSVGAVIMIIALTKNTGVSTKNTQGVQLLPTPPPQQVQRTAGAAAIPTQTAPQKIAVLTKLLAVDDAQTKEELEGQQESKVQASFLQGSVLIMMDPTILECVVDKLLTIKAVHLERRFFAINGNADLLQKEIAFLGDQGGFSTLAPILLPKNWCEWRTNKGGDNNADFDTHFKL